MKSHWTQEGYKGPPGIRRQMVFCPSEARKSPTRLSFPHCVPRQGSVQVCKSFSKLVALQIRHTQTPVARTLEADLSTDHRPSASLEQSGEGSLKCQPMCLRQRKYSQSVKDQGEDVYGARPLRTTSLKARFPPEYSLYFRPISLQLEVGPKQHPEDADGSVTPVQGPWKRIATPPSTDPQTLAFVKVDLGSCYPLVFANRLLHSLYIQAAGYKDFDIISE